MNAVLARLGRPSLPLSAVLRLVGDGVEILMQRVLREVGGAEPDSEQVARASALLLEEYENHLVESTHLYPEVGETLEELRKARLGVITNKPEALARGILAYFGLADRFQVILGGDSLPRRKPDPAPILEALGRCGVSGRDAVMVGDSATDIVAGHAAGVLTCGFSGGFRTREELQAANPDVIIDCFGELLGSFRPVG